MALVAMLGVFTSCDKQEVIKDTSAVENNGYFEANYSGLKVIIPNSFPKNILEFSEKTLPKNYKVSNSSTNISALTELMNSVETEFPDVSKIGYDEVEFIKFSKYFPEVKQEELKDNKEIYWGFFEKLIAYRTYQNLDKLKSSKIAYGGGSYTTAERNFVIMHARMKDGIEYAHKKCDVNGDDFASTKVPMLDKHQTQNDALRHAILIALIAKHGGKKYAKISKAVELAIEFGDIHEDSNPGSDLDKAMDKYNNRIGGWYFGTVAWVEKSCFICDRDVHGPSDDSLIDALHNYGYIYKNTVSDVNSTPHMTKLVYIKNVGEQTK